MNPRILGIIGGLALVVALLSPFILGSSKKVEQLFEAAETLYEQNDYEGAIGKYKEALKESKKLRSRTEAIDEDFTTFVNFKIAMSYVKLVEQSDDTKYYEKALEHVERADQTVKLAEYEERLIYLWGYILHKTGQLEQALEKLTQLIDNFPNSPFVEKAQEIITHINTQLGTSEEEEMEEVVPPTDRMPLWINDLSKFEAFNKQRNTTLVVPNRLRAEKHYVQAAKQYEDFTNTNSSTAEAVYALYWAGWCYFEAASNNEILLNQARNAFQRLIDLYGNSPYAPGANERLNDIVKWYAKEGYTHLNHERLEEATQMARDALDIDPSYQNAKNLLTKIKQKYFAQGNNEVETEEYNKAIPLLKKAIAIDSQFKEAYCKLGRAYLKLGEFEYAIAAAEKALAIDPNYECAKNIKDSIDIGEN